MALKSALGVLFYAYLGQAVDLGGLAQGPPNLTTLTLEVFLSLRQGGYLKGYSWP